MFSYASFLSMQKILTVATNKLSLCQSVLCDFPPVELKKRGFWLLETLLAGDQIAARPLMRASLSRLC